MLGPSLPCAQGMDHLGLESEAAGLGEGVSGHRMWFRRVGAPGIGSLLLGSSPHLCRLPMWVLSAPFPGGLACFAVTGPGGHCVAAPPPGRPPWTKSAPRSGSRPSRCGRELRTAWRGVLLPRERTGGGAALTGRTWPSNLGFRAFLTRRVDPGAPSGSEQSPSPRALTFSGEDAGRQMPSACAPACCRQVPHGEGGEAVALAGVGRSGSASRALRRQRRRTRSAS